MSRRAVGTAVFGGMLAASLIGIFLISMVYIFFQNARERVKGPGSRGRKITAGRRVANGLNERGRWRSLVAIRRSSFG
jgi:hypothetical protein